jgi:hypothetical protein
MIVESFFHLPNEWVSRHTKAKTTPTRRGLCSLVVCLGPDQIVHHLGNHPHPFIEIGYSFHGLLETLFLKGDKSQFLRTLCYFKR